MHPWARDVSAPIDKSEILDLLLSYIQSCLNWLVGPWSLFMNKGNCMSSSLKHASLHQLVDRSRLPIDWMKSSSTPFWSSEVYPHNKLPGWRGWYFTKLRIHEIWSTRGWNFKKHGMNKGMIFHLPTTFFQVVHHISPTRGNILTWPLGDLSVVHHTSGQSNWWVPGEINHGCIIHTFII